MLGHSKVQNEVDIHRLVSRNGPHIVNFLGHSVTPDHAFLHLEYVPNDSLFYFIDPAKGLPESLALRFLYQTALAVRHMHSLGVTHRDIKPENLLLDANFNLKLCDFGWSSRADARDPTDALCGTFAYMAPEMVFNLPHGPKTDIWCLGILLVEMLTGVPPFTANSLQEIMRELAIKTVQVNKPIHPKTRQLLGLLLERDQDKRPSIAEVLAHPALAIRKAQFDKRITKEQFMTLVSNYMVNKHIESLGDLPESILRMTETPFEEETRRPLSTLSVDKLPTPKHSELSKVSAPRLPYLPKLNLKQFKSATGTDAESANSSAVQPSSFQLNIRPFRLASELDVCKPSRSTQRFKLDRPVDLSVETKKERKTLIFDGPKRIGVPPKAKKATVEREMRPPGVQSKEVRRDISPSVSDSKNIQVERTRVNSKSLRDFLTKSKSENPLTSPENTSHQTDHSAVPSKSQSRFSPAPPDSLLPPLLGFPNPASFPDRPTPEKTPRKLCLENLEETSGGGSNVHPTVYYNNKVGNISALASLEANPRLLASPTPNLYSGFKEFKAPENPRSGNEGIGVACYDSLPAPGTFLASKTLHSPPKCLISEFQTLGNRSMPLSQKDIRITIPNPVEPPKPSTPLQQRPVFTPSSPHLAISQPEFISKNSRTEFSVEKFTRNGIKYRIYKPAGDGPSAPPNPSQPAPSQPGLSKFHTMKALSEYLPSLATKAPNNLSLRK